jgi:hypothetical protein
VPTIVPTASPTLLQVEATPPPSTLSPGTATASNTTVNDTVVLAKEPETEEVVSAAANVSPPKNETNADEAGNDNKRQPSETMKEASKNIANVFSGEGSNATSNGASTNSNSDTSKGSSASHNRGENATSSSANNGKSDSGASNGDESVTVSAANKDVETGTGLFHSDMLIYMLAGAGGVLLILIMLLICAIRRGCKKGRGKHKKSTYTHGGESVARGYDEEQPRERSKVPSSIYTPDGSSGKKLRRGQSASSAHGNTPSTALDSIVETVDDPSEKLSDEASIGHEMGVELVVPDDVDPLDTSGNGARNLIQTFTSAADRSVPSSPASTTNMSVWSREADDTVRSVSPAAIAMRNRSPLTLPSLLKDEDVRSVRSMKSNESGRSGRSVRSGARSPTSIGSRRAGASIISGGSAHNRTKSPATMSRTDTDDDEDDEDSIFSGVNKEDGVDVDGVVGRNVLYTDHMDNRPSSPASDFMSVDDSLYLEGSTVASFEPSVLTMCSIDKPMTTRNARMASLSRSPTPGGRKMFSVMSALAAAPSMDCPDDESVRKGAPSAHQLSPSIPKPRVASPPTLSEPPSPPVYTARRSPAASPSPPPYRPVTVEKEVDEEEEPYDADYKTSINNNNANQAASSSYGASVRPRRARAGLFSRRETRERKDVTPPHRKNISRDVDVQSNSDDEEIEMRIPAVRPNTASSTAIAGANSATTGTSAGAMGGSRRLSSQTGKSADPWNSFLSELSRAEQQFFNPLAPGSSAKKNQGAARTPRASPQSSPPQSLRKSWGRNNVPVQHSPPSPLSLSSHEKSDEMVHSQDEMNPSDAESEGMMRYRQRLL